MNAADLFTAAMVRAADDAASAYGYERPPVRFLGEMLARIPTDTRNQIGIGMAEGLIVAGDPLHTFTMPGLTGGKGPYRWFSANRGPGVRVPTGSTSSRLSGGRRVSFRLGNGGIAFGDRQGCLAPAHELLYYEHRPLFAASGLTIR